MTLQQLQAVNQALRDLTVEEAQILTLALSHRLCQIESRFEDDDDDFFLLQDPEYQKTQALFNKLRLNPEKP
jgi:hypothetical protein